MRKLAFFLLIAAAAWGQKTDHPTGNRITPPTIRDVAPLGVSRGTTVELTIEGFNLAKASAIYFSDPGIKGRIVRVKEHISGIGAGTVLQFPKWLPGNHSTTGPIEPAPAFVEARIVHDPAPPARDCPIVLELRDGLRDGKRFLTLLHRTQSFAIAIEVVSEGGFGELRVLPPEEAYQLSVEHDGRRTDLKVVQA